MNSACDMAPEAEAFGAAGGDAFGDNALISVFDGTFTTGELNVFAIAVGVVATGHVRVDRIVSCHDVGRAINPKMLVGQIEGAFQIGERRLENGLHVVAVADLVAHDADPHAFERIG